MRLLTLDRLADRYGCRPSDIACGPASDAALDIAAYAAASEFDGAVSKMAEGDGSPPYGRCAEALWQKWKQDAERERE